MTKRLEQSFQSYFAPAKLNLMLLVTGRRADGYHLLQTVFRLIDYGDTLTFALRDDGRIERTSDLAGISQEDDLTVRAARLLQRASGSRLGADISVEKRIPIGGGLGGGSSDAATTLLALNSLWDLNLSRARLQQLGVKLGADLPIFLFGQSALGLGIGDELQPIELLPAWYLVLFPAASVNTSEIFQDPDLKRDSNPIRIPPFSVAAARNDLQAVVCRRYPEVARHLAWLEQFNAARMTGSGACVFAEFGTEREARAVFDQRPATMNGIVAQGLDSHPLRALCD